MDFYQILLEIMEEKSFSIPDVARATGLSDSTIRSIISRKTKKVSLDVAFKMYKGLGVSLERLNGEEIKNTPKNNNLPQEETTLLKNYNESNNEGKKMILSYSDYISKNYKDNATDEVTATKEEDNKVIELSKKEKTERLQDYFSTIAAHNDDLTEEEKIIAEQKVLEALKKNNLI
ncbi:helix-turn-helix transcriptional regulator [Clostridium tertium]|uniref:helix-turn-helix domain-containing protein n=1 Tax=Clostridium tertium TaxID=1559 RepID=UPI000C0776DF|nr:helix-turn-helix transcriptional regulator [Clostridium tertium]MDB1955381.1 helix-turn-helix transcriptional regulator [Clostridium tertium]MDB1958937.1 helix-turn-helix transcriptional regulator [Clostridium tertium]MDB1963813.1 helix-turn-helix transcriptional regulator [Clostridium tertium]MDB1966096.1 helix-turn-helix transcriptional regulator [Clostridium tertium]